jgi:hypothetical protein
VQVAPAYISIAAPLRVCALGSSVLKRFQVFDQGLMHAEAVFSVYVCRRS